MPIINIKNEINKNSLAYIGHFYRGLPDGTWAVFKYIRKK